VSDPADAHDLVQEVYMRLLKLERADLIRSPQAYLYRVAANIAREYWLKHAARPRHVPVEESAEVSSAEVEAYESSTPEDHASTLERLGQLALMLDELSPKVSAALIWAHRDGHTYEEISERLSVPTHRVKKYLARALKHCRRDGNGEAE
jgi:RNA polymerase sigma factor (sigma-70 family)